ncbi:hypothetical protein HMPREF9318_00708 [Streptococcus urinalis FB127-CNA-2]|uniref:Thioesterase family protein n=1 Tax=Streptococcus urinalis 2285-97 TaxID=764291 RepID=G5KHF3_9STRE|nr:thioesterase family protein [Streptococcus urinalis]EHJ56506.1 thioesterase family protein [Streptococcus urinalis 2285-97]EKS22510.1 hypothetical protein HMPREF9318_00708 [Streptococcus urinalis FB127-CNA-2]VEF32323.1 thioesterase superfamily protein [Streptococcus urinalis]
MSITRQTFHTTPKHSAKFLGSGTLEVLATPALVTFMENTASTFIQKQLEEGKTSVGSEMAIQHLKASKIGEDIDIVITALKEESHRYDFRLEAFAKNELIAKACHTRVRIDTQRFLKSLEQ